MGNRKIIAALILVLPLSTVLPYLAMAILMSDIMESLNIGYSLAGLSMTIMLAISGLCMFLGSPVQSRIGIKNTILLAVWTAFLGSAVCFIASSFVVFFAGRIISGIGFGLATVSLMPYLSAWFTGNKRTAMITANLLANSIASIIAISLASPLRNLTGSWQYVFGVYAVFIAGIALLWTFFGKSNDELDVERLKADMPAKNASPLIKAFKIRQYQVLMVCSIFIMSVISVTTAFLPNFLENERGFSLAFAVMATNVVNITFIFGALLGGAVVGRTGRRKSVYQLGIFILMLGGLLVGFTGVQALIIVGAALIGLGFMFQRPAQTTMMMETVEPLDPILLGGAMAMVSGTGQMVSLVIPPIFSFLTDSIGMAGAMQSFFIVLIIPMILSFMLVETGQRTKLKEKSL